MTDTTALIDRLTTLRRSVEDTAASARSQATHALDRALGRVGLVRKGKRTRKAAVKKKQAARRPAARAKKKQA